MYIVEVEDLVYKYTDEEKETIALNGIDLKITQGEYVAILGHNGSGKSTLARHLNGLVKPSQGRVLIAGMDTRDDEKIWDIRKTCGMVFQNPDNQIVTTLVEDEIAFGPENLGLRREEIRERVDMAIDAVAMRDYLHKAPSSLSGGQKQRVAIASVLAMKPEIIVFDESTAMLDPEGRKDILSTMDYLNTKENMTIINITHHMDEAIRAKRIIVIEKGKIVLEGTAKEVFGQADLVKSLGLDLPQVTELANSLVEEGFDLAKGIISMDELVELL